MGDFIFGYAHFIKPNLRLLIVVFLSILLPATGMAQVQMAAVQSTTHHMQSLPDSAQSMTSMERESHECCNQDSNLLVCKNGQECKTSSVLQVPEIKFAQVSFGLHISELVIDFVPALAPDAVWHPPRS